MYVRDMKGKDKRAAARCGRKIQIQFGSCMRRKGGAGKGAKEQRNRNQRRQGDFSGILKMAGCARIKNVSGTLIYIKINVKFLFIEKLQKINSGFGEKEAMN